MSLIQDALKRQQEEMNKTAPMPLGKLETPAVPTPPPIQSKIPLRMMGQPKPEAPPPEPPKPPAPPTPPPAPDVKPDAKPDTAPRVLTHRKTGSPESPPDHAPPENKTVEAPITPQAEKRNQTVLAILLILLLVLGIGFYFAWPLLSTPKQQPAPEPGSAAPVIPEVASVPNVPTVPEVTPVSTPSAAPASPVPDKASAPETVATPSGPPSPGETDVSATGATSSVAVAPAPATPATAAIPEIDETKTAIPEVGAEPETPAAPVIWPPIKLTGLVKLGSTAAALINGKVVAPGDTIEGVLIRSVTKEGAVVRLAGEERLLRVGETAR